MTKAEQEAGSGPHGTIAEAIRHRYGELTTTERKPAQTLLGNYPFAGLETVAKFAERAGVSGPTILRLVAKLGYSGYAGFQRELRDELQAQLQSPLTKRPETAGEAAGRRPNFLESFGEAVSDNIRQTLDSVHQSEFDAVVELLGTKSGRSICLAGASPARWRIISTSISTRFAPTCSLSRVMNRTGVTTCWMSAGAMCWWSSTSAAINMT